MKEPGDDLYLKLLSSNLYFNFIFRKQLNLQLLGNLLVLSYLQIYIGENNAHKDASMIGFKAHEGVKARCLCNKLETKVVLLVGVSLY